MTGEEATAAVIDALESTGVDYLLVGSLSSSYFGIPRFTKDADFVLQLGSISIGQFVAALGSEFRFDNQMSFETVTNTKRYLLEVRDSNFQVELFLLSDDPFDQQRYKRRLRVPLLGRQVWMPTAEDVIIMKLCWAEHGARNKDIDDVRNVIAVQGDRIDWDYVYPWCDQHGTRQQLDAIRQSLQNL